MFLPNRGVLLAACWLFLSLAPPAGAADLRYVLTSTTHNIGGETSQITSSEMPFDAAAEWSVRRTILHGGKQEGVELITVDQGALRIRIVPTRGMSILDVRAGELRLGWDSPVKQVVHPQWMNLEARGGLGWLEGFGEWMVRCGLEFAGHPGRDQFVDNTGAKAEMDLTLHGRIGNLPASEVVVVVDEAPPHRIRVRGTVYERMFYGPKLRLIAEVSTVPGSNEFRIDDQVTNVGDSQQEMQLIYHANFGPPLLEKGALVHAAAQRVAPMNDHAAGGVDRYATYEAPQPGFVEEVYLLHPYADADGQTRVLLQNAAGDLGASLRWSVAELPYLTIWKNTAALRDGYVTGIEPGTCFPYNRRVEREFGRVLKLQPDQTHRYQVDIALLQGKQQVAEEREAVDAIRAGRPTEFHRNPPKLP